MNIIKALRLMLLAGIVMAGVLTIGTPAQAQVAFTFRVGFAPPELPVYEQPICPGDGYIWTPGYWDWDDEDGDYYWVPGTWVLAPEPGYLWTPGYWGWYDSAYVFYPGYWGPVVGFYGGINYGFGYFGHGYEGGRWEGGRFFYNRAVNRIDEREIRNVYNTRVVERNDTRVSFNGGRGGIEARPSQQEEAAARERHVGPVAAQQQHINAARGDRSLRAAENHGRPPIAATSRAGSFSGGGVEAARSGGNYNPPANRGGNARTNPEANRPEARNAPETRTDRPPSARNDNGGNRPNYTHPNDVPKHDRPQPPQSSGNPKVDQKYQRQQEKVYQKQEQEHQKLQQRQDQEHQRAAQKQANDAQKQQMEQRHQQQTQQMEQRHTQQQQQIQRQAPQPRQQPPHGGGEPHH